MSKCSLGFVLLFTFGLALFKKSEEFSIAPRRSSRIYSHSVLKSLHFRNRTYGGSDVIVISSQNKDNNNGTKTPTFESNDDNDFEVSSCVASGLPDFIETIVLKDVYSALVSFRTQYGHPNIPLGTVDGRKCEILRRMQRQGKLPSKEVFLLKEMGFRFDSLEDIYDKADFDVICERLVRYRKDYGNLQVPKKFKSDPELGAWVAMVRRLGVDGVRSQEERLILDEIGFEWKSTRKCGSAFMSDFREILAKLEGSRTRRGGDGVEELLNDDKSILDWVKMQRAAHNSGLLGEARVGYMNQLLSFGINWKEL